MKKIIVTLLSAIMIVCCGAGLSACAGKNNTPVTLATPTLTKSGVTLSWNNVENASGYVLKINGEEKQLGTTSYTLTNLSANDYICVVKAIGDGVKYLDSAYSSAVTIVYESNSPVITAESSVISIGKGVTVTLDELNLGLTVEDESDYTLSYVVKYNDESIVSLTENQFTAQESGYYTIDVTATDMFGAVATKRVNLAVNGTYLYSLDKVENIATGNDWFVRNSSNGGSTPAEIVEEDNGNKYYKITATAGEKTTYNMPLPAQNGVSIQVGKSYKAYITLWTNVEVADGETIEFSSVAPMVNATGVIDKNNKKIVVSCDFAAKEERISTFYVLNNTAKEVSYFIDNIVLVEVPSWNVMPVDISQGSDEVDENGNLKSIFGRADSEFYFYPEEIQNCKEGALVNVTLKYKIVSEVAMADSRGALGSYNKGTLFLTPNSEDFITISFDMGVNVGEIPNLKIVFIVAKTATIYIEKFAVTVYPEWDKMTVDIAQGSKEVDDNGNLKSTFTRADSEFRFYPDAIANSLAGDKVLVTLNYKIVSEVAMADHRGALGSYKGGTLFLTPNTENFLTETFEAEVEVENGAPYIKVVFIAAVSATMYIEEFLVEANVETAYGMYVREADLGLGGNTVYFLPSTTGMQTLSIVIKNTAGEIFIIDGGYDSRDYGGNDAKLIYDVISDLSETNNVVVKGWFFTHPHIDHYGIFADFIANYGSLVTIETIYYSWSEVASWYTQYTATPDVDINKVNAFKSAIPSRTVVVEPKTNDVFNFGSFSFKILYSPANDNYNFTGAEAYNFNNLSLVIKMNTSEKSILFLGDAGVASGEWLIENCSAADLTADIVQMAHHGQAGVNENVYQAIDPDVALWNCDKAVYENTSGKLQTLVVRGWMEQLGTTNYVSKDGIFIFN